MRILLTNGSLRRRSGTECYVVALGRGLKDRGHEVVFFSPRLGATAEQLEQDGFVVTDDLTTISEAPDLIHGQHSVASLRAACAFPFAPLMYICHDGVSPADEPLPSYLVDGYAAVDAFTAKRIVDTAEVPQGAVHILGNVVDTDVFQQRSNFRETARKALIYSGSVRSDEHFQLIRKVCDAQGLELDEAGERVDGFFEHPEKHLGEYDIIFCKARCAMEAFASGAYVVLIGDSGMGPEVTLENVVSLRLLNFGREALTVSYSEEYLRQRIAAYDASVARDVSDWAHAHLTPGQWLDAVEHTYRELLEKPAVRSDVSCIPVNQPIVFRDWELSVNPHTQCLEAIKSKRGQGVVNKLIREIQRVFNRMK